ncbi:hypothetical protein HPB50_006132 [Hyalomma asiaticum]|uniref:Uncharacterized protein n=1 Tax=Hyalomma asiaticum TaxID=266040 RepID=A0ACB7S0M1_HYAAI|nr:hypothetical protein HPB50_006132 [Hyalomma asiaticum]
MQEQLDMCQASSKEAAAAVAIVCMFINAFNVAYVLMPEIEERLRMQSWFAYVPDVHDLSSLVGSQASKYTMLSLAVISIIFDAFIFLGSIKGLLHKDVYDESSRSAPGLQAAVDEDETEETVRQFLHFGYVIMRAVVKFINAFNVAYVLKPEIKRQLMKQSWFVYVPDVHDVSKFVGVEKSNYIALGLAGISIIFDAFILVGTVQHKTEVAKPHLHRSGCTGASPCAETPAASNLTDTAEDDGTRPHGANDSRHQTASREQDDNERTTYGVLTEPPTVRQFLHFSYVIMRAALKITW